jgi:hypothetical protein
MIFINKQLLIYQPVDESTQQKVNLFVGSILHAGAVFRGENPNES